MSSSKYYLSRIFDLLDAKKKQKAIDSEREKEKRINEQKIALAKAMNAITYRAHIECRQLTSNEVKKLDDLLARFDKL